jgi:hypothetical protein
MKYESYFNVSNSLIHDESIGKILFINLVRHEKTKFLLNSMRFFIDEVRCAKHHADNFVRDETTIVLSGRAYRIPRIIKNYLSKTR